MLVRAGLAAFAALGIAASAHAQDAPARRVLRLGPQDAARLAVQRDLSANAAREGRAAALARTRETDALYDPLASVSATSGAARAETASALGGAAVLESDEQEIVFGLSKTFATGSNLRLEWVNRRSDSNSTFASFSPQWASTVRLTARHPLLRDGGLEHHDRLAQSAAVRRRLAEWQYRQALADVALGAETAYWDLVLARANLEVARGARALAAEELRIVEAQAAAGRLTQVDVLESRTGEASADEAVIVAEATAATAADQMVRVVAPPERADDVAAWDLAIEAAAPVEAMPQLVEAAAHVAAALAARPEVLAARLLAEDAALRARLAVRDALPRVDLTGTLSTDGLGRGAGEAGEDLGSGDFLGWSLGVQIEVPILNTQGSSRRTAAEATARELQWRVRDAETRAVLDVRAAVRQIDAAGRRIGAAKLARELSERKLQLERDRLQQGLSTAFLVSRAREELTGARVREARANVDHHVAVARLRRADGSNLDELLPAGDGR